MYDVLYTIYISYILCTANHIQSNIVDSIL